MRTALSIVLCAGATYVLLVALILYLAYRG